VIWSRWVSSRLSESHPNLAIATTTAQKKLTLQPGGHLILSTISRTPLSQLLTLTLAEDVLRLVTPGTHTYSKFIKPAELRRFVHAEMGGTAVWYGPENAADLKCHEIGETRGIVYDPLRGQWFLWDETEGTVWKEVGEGCNYMFSVRKRADAS
jgi:polyprenyldihydroxybenzoate methyltransferase/3-demethylubiquinol 3-O-methyltransferase